MTAPAPAPSVELGKQRLKEYAPDQYGQVADLDSPRVGEREGDTTYTWEYVEQKTPGSVKVRTVTIALKPDGSFSGLSMGK
ncbi:MAG: hypothetical protein FDZ70_03970 [Actinobacteria bacterium]|nr:MAG: hypothetical protein FDZ70_03970 [Actinomycetota bacterium]